MLPMLVVFATMDPRGSKIGGIETHIRQILRNHPAGTDLLLVGIDEAGDLAPGVPLAVPFGGRSITFLPVAHVPADEARVAAPSLFRSTTLRFVAGGLRHLPALRRLVAGRSASADLPRVEFAILPLLLRLPYALTIHSDLTAAASTDSLLKRHRGLKHWSEWLAFAGAAHVFAVSEELRGALAARHRGIARKSSVLPVPVDTRLFRPTPFPEGERFHLAYAGRLDAVKDPALMVATIAALARRLDGRVAFHLIGAADPETIPGFAAIRPLTERHGMQDAEGVAARLRQVHCGLMTSHSEGLPCFLLETLASGRAFVAASLPSFTPFIRAGETGALVPRHGATEATAEALAEALADLWHDIRAGRLDPARIAASVAAYSVDAIFAGLFATHARIRIPGGGTDYAETGPEAASRSQPASSAPQDAPGPSASAITVSASAR
ncbi:glycosyltransferase family 4 protein [Rhabdaerophilum calidifontis]|uniref:glycosyltransferase family 4 protein n=1 Tax=Rhabdaerophilum calidifontis TaxID=2604328 RepID=UPI00123C0B1A|nr:glycosyltransferase [Rhabdaerophilum calidifontis]